MSRVCWLVDLYFAVIKKTVLQILYLYKQWLRMNYDPFACCKETETYLHTRKD